MSTLHATIGDKAGDIARLDFAGKVTELVEDVANRLPNGAAAALALLLHARVLRMEAEAVEARTRPEPESLDPERVCQRVYDLLYEQGPLPMAALAAFVGARTADVARVVARSDWFARRDGLVHIAMKNEATTVSERGQQAMSEP